MEPPLVRYTASYYQEGSENPTSAQVLTAGAGETNNYGFAVFVVNNNEIIIPTLDQQRKLTGWSKVTFDHIVTNPYPSMTLFAFNVEESDLQQLIGENVRT